MSTAVKPAAAAAAAAAAGAATKAAAVSQSASSVRFASSLIVLARNPHFRVHTSSPSSPSSSSSLPMSASLSSYDYRILFMQRSSTAKFMANRVVFPGGVVERDVDHDDTFQPGGAHSLMSASTDDGDADTHAYAPVRHDCDERIGYRVAGIRELFEETGVLLATPNPAATAAATAATAVAHTRARAPFVAALPPLCSAYEFADDGETRRLRDEVHADAASFKRLCQTHSLTPSTHRLLPWAHWLTPVVERRRYDTWFYVAAVDGDGSSGGVPHTSTDTAGEAATVTWMTPAEALLATRTHPPTALMAPPTLYMLEELAALHRMSDVLAHAAQPRPLPLMFPTITMVTGSSASSAAAAKTTTTVTPLYSPGGIADGTQQQLQRQQQHPQQNDKGTEENAEDESEDEDEDEQHVCVALPGDHLHHDADEATRTSATAVHRVVMNSGRRRRRLGEWSVVSNLATSHRLMPLSSASSSSHNHQCRHHLSSSSSINSSSSSHSHRHSYDAVALQGHDYSGARRAAKSLSSSSPSSRL